MFKWLKWRRLPEGETTAGEERRTAVRFARDRKTRERLTAAVGSSGWPAVVADLSATGVGLVVGIWQQPGTWLPVRLVNRGRDVNCPMQAKVVYTTQGADGYWFSGCVFRDHLEEAEMAELI